MHVRPDNGVIHALGHDTRNRPGRMTDFIKDEALLGARQIWRIQTIDLADLEQLVRRAAALPLCERQPMSAWIEAFE